MQFVSPTGFCSPSRGWNAAVRDILSGRRFCYEGRLMCGCIWTAPDCNDRLDWDRRPQLLTYIRLLDAAGQRLRREPRWFSPASTSTAPRHRRKPCRSTHQVGKRRGDRFAISCHLLQLPVRPPFLDCRFASGRLHRKRRLISRVACEHSPHDPRVLVGKSHGRDIGMAPLPHLAEPEASRILLAPCAHC